MKPFTFACYVGVFATAIIAYTYATVGGQYSVNVHFVPPLVNAPCQIANFWSPSNITCALCFCMTGGLSRCIPQPGCRPNIQNTTTTTMSPEGSPSSSTEPGAAGNSPGTTAPPQSVPDTDPQSSPQPGDTDTPTEEPSTEAPSDSVPGKVRGAKPGKLRRRRRHSS